MELSRYDDTICALGTIPGNGSAVAVVRVSGPSVIDIVQDNLRIGRNRRRISSPEPRKVYFGYFVDSQGTVVDEVLFFVMRAPNTYTGQDLLEVHCHGAEPIWRRIISILCEGDCRMAEAGEFTRRALINGKITAMQAEAIGTLVAASNDRIAELALRHKLGESDEFVGKLRKTLLSILAEMEYHLDFPDEAEAGDFKGLVGKLENLLSILQGMAESRKVFKRINDGILAVITGAPNVGKSSIFNLLVGRERAIVTEFPGTTRDVVEELVVIGGHHVRLVDTAGLRRTSCPIEEVGIAKAMEVTGRADIVIEVHEAGECLGNCNPVESGCDATGTKKIMVANKNDLLSMTGQTLSELWCPLCAISGDGGDELRRRIAEACDSLTRFTGNRGLCLMTDRQSSHIEKACRRIEGAMYELVEQKLDLAVLELKEAVLDLVQMSGRIDDEEVLDELFSTFCVGK